MTTAYTTFLDVDGVLVDFCTGIHAAHGIPYDKSNWPYPVNDFYIAKYMHLSDADFFAPCGTTFWSALEWMNDGHDILNAVQNCSNELYLLTSPCNTPGCLEGKKLWIEYNLSQYANKVLYGAPKSACAHKKSILIDDCDNNVNMFREHGGNAILVPRPWNSNYWFTASAVSYIQREYEAITKSGEL